MIDERIQEADAVLQSMNVTAEAINEHLQLNERLKEQVFIPLAAGWRSWLFS
jgi:hypothetical protein